jgi:hypothetical protein
MKHLFVPPFLYSGTEVSEECLISNVLQCYVKGVLKCGLEHWLIAERRHLFFLCDAIQQYSCIDTKCASKHECE